MILRGGIMIDGIKTPSEEGSVQGSPLSPLLSNVVLDERKRLNRPSFHLEAFLLMSH